MMVGLLQKQQPLDAAPPVQQTPPSAAQEVTDASQAGAATLDDPLLKQAEQALEASVPQEHRNMYESIVVAGMNVMFSKETAKLMDQQLDQGGDLAASVADGVAKLVMIVFNESGQAADAFAPAAVLAAVTLMCQALDYAEQTRGAQVTEDVVAQCTKQTQMKVLRSFGISEDQVNQVASAGQQQGGAASPMGA